MKADQPQNLGTIQEKEVSIAQLLEVINNLPEDEPEINPRAWYRTQKEHWLGWMRGYTGPGAYNRKNWGNRDAKLVYNHIVEPRMLLYLIRAIPTSPELVIAAEDASKKGSTLMEKSAAIRRVAPWSGIYQIIWGKEKPGLVNRIKRTYSP